MQPAASDAPAIIAGAGIGGLATALFLARQGISSLVLERRTALDEIGAGIQLSPNASRLLIGLGLGPALARRGFAPERVVIRDAGRGRELGTVALGAEARRRYGAPYYVLQRADLHMILLDAARATPGVSLLVGRALTAARTEGEQVRVEVARASGAAETLHGSFLVGADGLWSATRTAMGDRREPAPAGVTAWRATLPARAAPAFAREAQTGLWLGRRLHVVHYPVSEGELVNLVLVQEGPVSEGQAAPILPPGLAPALRALVAAASTWTPWPLYDLPAGHIAAGRIALVGDAGHPVLPYLAQGGALAIEDAAVLADALSRDASVVSAFEGYDWVRGARARHVQTAARDTGRAYHAGFPLALARNVLIGRLGPVGMLSRLDWLYGWQPD